MPLRVLLRCLFLLGAAANAAAQGMEALRVDPALLGGTAAVKKEPAPAKAETAPAEVAKPAKPVVLDGPQKLPAETAAPVAATKDDKAQPTKRQDAVVAKPAADAKPVAESKPVAEPAPVEKAATPAKAVAAQPPAEAKAAPAVVAKPATAAKEVPVAPAAAVVAPVTQPAMQPLAAAPSAPVQARAIPLEATRTAGGASLPALRVDPALLRPATPTAVPQTQYASRGASPITGTAQAAAPGGMAPVQRAARAGTPVELATPAPLAQSNEPPQVEEQLQLAPTYSAHVAAGLLPAPVLKPSRDIVAASKYPDEPRPTFISAERMHGRNDVEMVAEGAAEMRRIGTVLNADKLTYWNLDDEVEALGNVRLEKDRDIFTGPSLRMRVGDNVGGFEQPVYSITRTVAGPKLPGHQPSNARRVEQVLTAQGVADRIEFKGEGLYRLSNATYSTCAPEKSDWYAEVRRLDLDYNRGVAEGDEGRLVFQGTPILYSPWLDFSLNQERKSGLLTPTTGSSSKSGLEVVTPWYWNIAPNMDATISPRLLTKRGMQVGSEFRYLNYKYRGNVQAEYLPSDRLAHTPRWSYVLEHWQDLGHGFSGALNLSAVSDDTYFSDLSTRLGAISQTNLLRQGQLSYGANWWGVTMRAQSFQTLQDPSAPPVLVPYRRLPQVNLFAQRPDMPFDSAFALAGEYVRFAHPTDVTGRRTMVYPQLSLPLQTSYFQVTPKLGVNVTHYQLERQASTTPSGISRNVPIFSLDSKLVFERPLDMLGQSLTQTLEPRLYYLYVPKREQSQIPVFDTGLADFNFAQVFAENRYSGNDRIADANQLTAAVTSRLIDPATGSEVLKGMIGQRYYFSSQHVTLPAVGATPAETPRTGRTADLLAALSGLIMPKTYLDTGIQYNPHASRVERLNVGGRFQPETTKVLNAGYRYTRDLLGQVDLSGQWPLGRGWYGVGRYNFSTKDGKLVESVGGLEFNAGCWVGRFVIQRVATQSSRANTSFFIQLELNGLARLGFNPLDLLKRNIPGYSLINQPTVDPVLGSQ